MGGTVIVRLVFSKPGATTSKAKDPLGRSGTTNHPLASLARDRTTVPWELMTLICASATDAPDGSTVWPFTGATRWPNATEHKVKRTAHRDVILLCPEYGYD